MWSEVEGQAARFVFSMRGGLGCDFLDSFHFVEKEGVGIEMELLGYIQLESIWRVTFNRTFWAGCWQNTNEMKMPASLFLLCS